MYGKTIKTIKENLKAQKEPKEGISDELWEKVLNHYSEFIDKTDKDGFLISSVVKVKNFYTPRPLLHLMCSNHFEEYGIWGSFWDQFCGGFSCLDSVLAGKMSAYHDTNYVPTAPEMQDTRRFFVYEDGSAWPMFPIGNYEDDEYSKTVCLQGLDWQTISANRNNLYCELKVIIHPNYPCELWKITIQNKSDKYREIRWFSTIRINIDSYPFYYFVPRVVCEGIVENGALVFLNHDKNNKHQRHAFFTSVPAFDKFDMMGEVFDGITGRAPIPPTVQRGSLTNSLGLQPYAGLIASAQFNVSLSPNETQQWVLIFGSCPYQSSARKEYIEKIKAECEHIDKVENDLNKIWKQKIYAHCCKTPDKEFDRYFNIWSRYQARNQARFVRALDKVGYRDIMQDLIGVCSFESKYVRKMLIRSLHYQLPDGRAIRQYEKFKGGGHDLRMYMDSAGWIPDILTQYLKETGDFEILDEKVPYFDMKTLQPDKNNTGTVYEHASKAVLSLFENTGFHGLCKIGYGDWNDALSGIGGQNGVSVWLSCLCVYAAQKMSELAKFIGKPEDADMFENIVKTMTNRINQHGWDGRWYIYAINWKGNPIGSSKNSEGKIHLNVNTWAIFTGIARSANRDQIVWKSIEENLYTPLGYKLLAPAYTLKSRDEVGRIADQKPGMFENGSIYTHGLAFYLYALVRAGKIKQCYDWFTKTIPSAYVQEISTSPKHQQSNFTVGDEHPNYGIQLFSGFTGSLPWYRRVAEELLGVIPQFDLLLINPHHTIPWEEYSVRKLWRGKEILVKFKKVDTAQVSVKLNGEFISKEISLNKLTNKNIIEVEF